MGDPFPAVDGGGLRQLEQAGIETRVGVLADEARRLNAPYLKRVTSGIPWVIAKWAMTVDGRIATVSGESQWITGPQARQDVHHCRSRVDAIVAGMGTVVTDDPLLTARLPAGEPPQRVAVRVVLCRHRLPSPKSRLVGSIEQAPLILFAGPSAPEDEASVLRQQGAQVIRLATDESAEMVRLVLQELGTREMTNILVEGGGELLSSFLAADQVDEYHVYVGPKLFGGRAAPGPVAGPGIESMADAVSLNLIDLRRLGDDFRATYRRSVP